MVTCWYVKVETSVELPYDLMIRLCVFKTIFINYAHTIS